MGELSHSLSIIGGRPIDAPHLWVYRQFAFLDCDHLAYCLASTMSLLSGFILMVDYSTLGSCSSIKSIDTI